MKSDLDLALEAIIANNATDEAYRVAAEQGWFELVPGIIYQQETPNKMSAAEQLKLSADQARAIIKQAKQDEMYDADVPEDDATCLKEAETLVDMAEQAWAQYIRGEEVEKILKLANRAPEGADGAEPETPVAEAEPAAEADDDEEKAPPPDLSQIPDNLKNVEPWQDYKNDTTKAITDGINILVEENPDDLADVLGHIWAFESAHKNRVKVVKHVKAAWESARPGQTPPVQEAEPEPAKPEPEPAKAKPKAEKAQPAPAAAGGDDQAYKTLREGIERQLVQERLHVPKPPEEAVPDVPWHWHDIPENELHNLYGQFSAMAYYKSYIVSREERLAMHCRQAADELANALLLKKGAEGGKDIKVTVIQAEVESDEHVKTWRKRQRMHEAFREQAKREMDSYQKLTEQLSRMETMRHNAWERSKK